MKVEINRFPSYVAYLFCVCVCVKTFINVTSDPQGTY